MPLDLDTLKARLGIDPGDVSKDAAITAVAAQAQALCEAYCDRKFDHAAEVETFDPAGQVLLLRRWPIDPATLIEITDGNARVVPANNYRVDFGRGMIRGRAVSWAPGWSLGWSPLTVSYVGGLDPWPSDLAWSVTGAFDILWSETPGAGLPAGPVSPAGEIRRYSVVGAYSVETQGGGVSEIGANAGAAWGPLTPAVVAGLDAWRRESRLGAG